MKPNKTTSSYLRNFTFGTEDSLVSTVGLLSGIAAAGIPKSTIILTGAILIFVEAFSMAVGSFLSEYQTEIYENHGQAKKKTAFIDAIIMFFSYLFSGFIPLIPYAILEPKIALYYSIAMALISLLILGIIGGKIAKINITKNALRMMIIGGIAIAVGVVIGKIFNI